MGRMLTLKKTAAISRGMNPHDVPRGPDKTKPKPKGIGQMFGGKKKLVIDSPLVEKK